jgi:hypothetical protein
MILALATVTPCMLYCAAVATSLVADAVHQGHCVLHVRLIADNVDAGLLATLLQPLAVLERCQPGLEHWHPAHICMQ